MDLARCRRICVRPFSIASATSCARRAGGRKEPVSTGSKWTAGSLEEAIGHEAIERYEHALATLRLDEREAIIGRVEMGYSRGARGGAWKNQVRTPRERRRSARWTA